MRQEHTEPRGDAQRAAAGGSAGVAAHEPCTGDARGPARRTPRLSKSRFQSGLQCPKKLWLKCFEPRLADPIDDVRAAIFDQGNRVGELARDRFPGGILITEDYTQPAAALAKTRDLIDGGAGCLYEAALQHDGVLVRADVLVHRPDGSWDLIEVKSTSKAKPEHVTDAAIQTYVAEGAGLRVNTTGILHLDTSYVYEGGVHDLERLFALSDVTEEARSFLSDIPALLDGMKQLLADDCPDVRIGKHCTQPYDCDFRGHCHDHLPDFPVTQLPRIDADLLDSLLSQGLLSMRDVPLDHPGLSETQAAACELVQVGVPRFMPGLAEALAPLTAPLHFLDFETVAPALPLYPGTRPYQALPVQWSCHTMLAGGTLEHRDYLHEQRSDPRRDFAESLLSSLPRQGRIVVYSAYENTILAALAADLPDLAAPLGAVRERLFDLLPVVRAFVRHPMMNGRTSLKYALPALADDLKYDHLVIQTGATAGLRYAAALAPDFPEEERVLLFADLREYCATDTLALVRLFEALGAQAAREGDSRR